MNDTIDQPTKKTFQAFVPVLAIVLIAGNLRSPITAVGPVLGEVSKALSLTNLQASLLISIPLFVFAFLSVVVSRLCEKYRIKPIVFFALFILMVGLCLRITGTVYFLFLGSFLIGLGICVGNVIMPGYIKNVFPDKIGVMTGLYSVSMNLMAALASGFSVVIGKYTGYGWKGSMGVWIILSFLALCIWLFEKSAKKRTTVKKSAQPSSKNSLFRSSQAWNISLFMGIQSLVYYCVISWIPAVLLDYGLPKESGGWVLSVMQLAMLPVTFFGPIVASRLSNQRPLIVGMTICMVVSIVLLVFFQATYIYLAAVLLGMSSGLAFSLSMLFFSIRTKNSENAIKISGMAQSIGYLLAAFGPPVFGKLHDFDSSWNFSFYFLLLTLVALFYFGWQAAGNKYVENY
ncbi:MFS transporter [Myroides ceti]|uniref:MFS transporter n=1 Tax=Paenimyroides ceti TaxID=395087 RepID=A0ABT8CQH8_9FLAO|nr:MFS transporter [Paenimyroides ceti]MDN3706768.1 MFS transporter [Paenimyroides ceti]